MQLSSGSRDSGLPLIASMGWRGLRSHGLAPHARSSGARAMGAPPTGEPVDEAQARRTAACEVLLDCLAQPTVTTPSPAPVIADRAAQLGIDPEIQQDRVVRSGLSVQDPVGHQLADQQLEVLERPLRHSLRAFLYDYPSRLGWASRARVDLVEGTDGWIHESSRRVFAAAQVCYPEFSARMPMRMDFRPPVCEAEEEMT